MKQEQADVIVVGGGLGGCAAALAVAKMGLRVIMTEETDWIGGQLTSQAVPPDEHQWIEKFGCTKTYREFRNRIRAYYKNNYPLTDQAKKDPFLNPGNGWVSRLSHEPKVALCVLQDMLAPYINSNQVMIHLNSKLMEAEMSNDKVASINIQQQSLSQEIIKLTAPYFVDATECGELLPLTNTEYVTGAEAKQETGEPHALDQPNPSDIQAITYVLAVEYVENGDFVIPKPAQYDFWKTFIPTYSDKPLLSWYAVNSADITSLKEFTLLPNSKKIADLFTYRRAIDTRHLAKNLYEGDISLINWPQNDYFLGSIIDVSEKERQRHLGNAKQLSLSLLYWLQTEAPRYGGGRGYPELRLATTALGTEDGLAKYPYIRESRRIKAVYTITERDVSKDFITENERCTFEDSVGVGSYHLDMHHTTVTNRTFYIPSKPYEIPLGALLPVRLKNLLPACKNIGTTQITNSCYRLHPTEWNIGESVGYLIAYAIDNDISPHQVRVEKNHLSAYQQLLINNGVEIHWPADLE
ncbi:FAD-dependent oxidoreductase [Gracilibacillus phocaeensis]|uniref:FAD-dependent oxidoreductase n=1 Tax=Gracilibacillus phocaeensis TaxID=2042304 RepID=UPI00103174B5|nr:FAD-dependent oxidoreductase [Gracilibacillus phocaeensis]